jgi:ABC-type multidrug transport system fused ATPase/permease subunit
MREIRIYGIENRLLTNAKSAASSFAFVSARYHWVSTLPKYLIEFCLLGGVSALIIIMHYAQLPRDSIFALIAVFAVAVIRLAPVVNFVITGLIQMRYSGFVIDRLYELIGDAKPCTLAPGILVAGGGVVENIEVIELTGVEFRYEGQIEPVLQDVSLVIRRGESIGLVGPSGGGKTTLAEIILGFWDPSSGDIKINGLPRSSLSAEDLRRHFAYIPQQIFLMDASIADNISLLDPETAVEVRRRVLEAASAAQLGPHLASLPEGIDTCCGENGSRLSGGQRQRIALARAFYHNRSVLVMDEATSALDYDTEREIIEEIRHLKGRITMVVIAHRLETVADCDRLFRVENGMVREIDRSELRLMRGVK